jgi:hypothetical protein
MGSGPNWYVATIKKKVINAELVNVKGLMVTQEECQWRDW